MKRNVFFSVLTALSVMLLISACGKDNNTPTPTPTPKPTPTPVANRNIKYEVTGNFSGIMEVTYTQAGGGVGTQPEITLPWTKEITCDPSVGAVTINVSGRGGVEGQSFVVKIYAGGVEKRTVTGVAASNGIAVAITNPYVF